MIERDLSMDYPGVTILGKVAIGKDVIIQPGTIVGSDGVQVKRNDTFRAVKHKGWVHIGDRTFIGANCVIDRGLNEDDVTRIGENCMIGAFSHISHNNKIGDYCILTSSVKLGGTVTLGAWCWIGINAQINAKVTIGEKVFISMGAVVTKDVKANSKVIGRNIGNIITRNDR